MHYGLRNICLSQKRKGAALCQILPNVACLAGPHSLADCCPSTSGRSEAVSAVNHCTLRSLSIGLACSSSLAVRSFARSMESPVRFASTSSVATPTTEPKTPVTSAPDTSLASREDFPVGLAQLYPDPDAIPESVLERIRHQLFGKPVQPGEQTGRRALARPLQGRVLADWYFMPPSEVPGFHNEEREYERSKALNRRHRKRAEEDGEGAAGGKAGGKKK